ncbi:MAG: helix-turn-helix domain-containing protein [Candidatus Marinimicrobia bacterium]|nr:helix-turn-helix domain-containing protein [Candidatus Neomarinimicrobiota bacterium]
MAKLTVHQREQLICMLEDGVSKSDVALELEISRVTVDKWLHRYVDEGPTCLDVERSSAPHDPTRKLTSAIKRRILSRAMRNPDCGLQSYSKSCDEQLSTTSIHQFLKTSGLNTTQKRINRVIRGLYKINDQSLLIGLEPEQQRILVACFKNRSWMANKPGKNYIFLRIPFPIRFFRRKYYIIFIFDTFDFTVRAVIDERAFFDPDQRQTLNKTIAQNDIDFIGNNRDAATILVWYSQLLKGKPQDAIHIFLSTLKMPQRGTFRLLEHKLESFPISLSYTTSTEIKFLPWIKHFLAQLDTFRAATLDEKLYQVRERRHSIRLNICSSYLSMFLKTYNQTAHPYFPFFGLSPNTFRYSEKPTPHTCKIVATMFDLIMTRDRTFPNQGYPSMDQIMDSSTELMSTLDKINNEYEVLKRGDVSYISRKTNS